MTELQEYITTGMLGAYHPESAILQQGEGGINTIFRDTDSWRREGHYVRERKMLIEGKCFHISSVFPSHPTATPTDKMLELIDVELKKIPAPGKVSVDFGGPVRYSVCTVPACPWKGGNHKNGKPKIYDPLRTAQSGGCPVGRFEFHHQPRVTM